MKLKQLKVLALKVSHLLKNQNLGYISHLFSNNIESRRGNSNTAVPSQKASVKSAFT